MKVRIDKLLVERGLVPSRERAQAMILSGRVLVNEQKIEKAGATVDHDAVIRLLGDDLKYVGRGGLKAQVDAARAQLELALIDLDHTVIRAPEAGQLGEIGVRLGQYVTNGTQFFTLVPPDRLTDLFSRGVERVEERHRILKDHRDPTAA